MSLETLTEYIFDLSVLRILIIDAVTCLIEKILVGRQIIGMQANSVEIRLSLY